MQDRNSRKLERDVSQDDRASDEERKKFDLPEFILSLLWRVYYASW